MYVGRLNCSRGWDRRVTWAHEFEASLGNLLGPCFKITGLYASILKFPKNFKMFAHHGVMEQWVWFGWRAEWVELTLTVMARITNAVIPDVCGVIWLPIFLQRINSHEKLHMQSWGSLTKHGRRLPYWSNGIFFGTLKKSSEIDHLQMNTWYGIQGLGQLGITDIGEQGTKLPVTNLKTLFTCLLHKFYGVSSTPYFK